MSVSLPSSSNLTLRQPGSLLNLSDEGQQSPIQKAWETILSDKEINTSRFIWKKEGERWICRINGPIEAKALNTFLSVLAQRPVTEFSVNSEKLENERMKDIAHHISAMTELCNLDLNGSFTNTGMRAITNSLIKMEGPIELRLNDKHKGFWGASRELPDFAAFRPKHLNPTRANVEQCGLCADELLISSQEGSLEDRWKALVSSPEIFGRHFYLKRTIGREGVSIECQMDKIVNKSAFAALMPCLFESGASLKLEISSKSCDDEILGYLSRSIEVFTGKLDLSLTGSFGDSGMDVLSSALHTCPGAINNLTIRGVYTLDRAQALTEVAAARRFPMFIMLPTIWV